jgi:three-Cys-motif partner protein
MEEKYRLLWQHNRIFSTGMKNEWPRRVYVDLFAGPGRVYFKETGAIHSGSPLLALDVPDPFSKYIFCDKSRRNIKVLEQRVRALGSFDVEYLCGDANELIVEVLQIIPSDALVFAFLDPHKTAQLPFRTVEALARRERTDLLVNLPIGMDLIRRLDEWRKPDARAIETWAGDPDWREAWERKPLHQDDHVFLANLYARSMDRLGHLPTTTGQMHLVRHRTQRRRLYYLGFFSRHRLGYKFWKEAQVALQPHGRIKPQYPLFPGLY